MSEPTLSELKRGFAYLDMLRESGVTNIYGARPYLERDCKMKAEKATVVLRKWMQTFAHDKTPAERAAIANEKASALSPSQRGGVE